MEQPVSSTILRLCSFAVVAGLIYESCAHRFPDPILLCNLGAILVILAGIGIRKFWLVAAAFLALKCATRLFLEPGRGHRYDLLPMLLMLAVLGIELLPKAFAALKRPSEEDWVNIFFLILGLFYLEAAIYKATNFSLWVTGSMVFDLLQYRDIQAPAAITRIRNIPGVAPALSLFTLAFEACFIITYFVRSSRIPLVLLALLFHLACNYLFSVDFYAYYLPMLFVLLLWELRRCPSLRFRKADS